MNISETRNSIEMFKPLQRFKENRRILFLKTKLVVKKWIKWKCMNVHLSCIW